MLTLVLSALLDDPHKCCARNEWLCCILLHLSWWEICHVCVTDDSVAAAASAVSDNTTAGTNNASEGVAGADNEQNTSSSPGVGRAGVRRDIYAEQSATQHHDQHQHSLTDRHQPDADAAVLLDDNEIAYQRLRGSKETIYSKLKNRIRTLEDNLNLTNRYQYISIL